MSSLYGRNTTSGTILVSSWKTYSTNSTSVSVINVQSILDDSLFNAYEFIYNQVPYYYVVDGSHNYWVSDLSSIGYKLYEEPRYEFILVDYSTGRVTHGVESLNQIEFSPTGYFLIESDSNVIFVVELPTVSVTGDWDDGNQLYPYGGGSSINTFFAVGEVKDATTDGSSTATVPYNSENSYCIFDWFTKDAIGLSDVVLVNNNGNLAFSNVSDHTFNIRWFNVAVCSSNQASVVTVYDSGNTAYNSFKYTIDNNDYYYVLDGVQNAWTNDLSVIGYSLTPPVQLPTVTYNTTSYGLSTGTALVSSGDSTAQLRAWGGSAFDGNYFQYDNTKKYAFYRYSNGSIMKDAGGIFQVIWSRNSSSDPYCLCAKNITDIPQDFYSGKIAECSSANAQAIIVYDIEYGYATNAFKFNLNGTYYYSILSDMLHPGEWTDDLSSEGYTETPPLNLPTVSTSDDIGSYNWCYPKDGTGTYYNTAMPMTAGSTYNLYTDYTSYGGGTTYNYDATKSYGVVQWQTTPGTKAGAIETVVVDNGSGKLALKNVSSNTITVYQARVAVCSSAKATIITVYDSSNNPFNAFKYTASGTDYYYVLDGTQTDWTEDLAGIGYHLPAQYIEVILYLSRTLNTVTFSANDYWASLAETTVSVNALNDFGVPLRTNDNKKFISSAALSNFSFEPIALYDNNDNDVQADMSNFYCAAGPNNPSSDYGYNINIYSINPYQTAVKTWKCRITKL